MFCVFGAGVVALYARIGTLFCAILMFFVLFGYSLYLQKKPVPRCIIAPTAFIVIQYAEYAASFAAINRVLKVEEIDVLEYNTFQRFLFLLLCKLTLTFTLMLILKLFANKESMGPLDILLYVFSPLITSISFFTFVITCFNRDAYNSTQSYYILMAISVYGLVIENLLVFFFFQSFKKSEKKNKELEIMSMLQNAESKRYAEIEKIYESVSLIKHDLKEQLSYAEELIKSAKPEKAQEHINLLRNHVETVGVSVHTGNSILDSLIYSKLSANQDIKFTVFGTVENLSTIKDWQIVSLFGNMLDNAIDYLSHSEQKYIELCFSYTAGYQNVECKNPITKSVLKENPSLVTGKSDSVHHGYGIKSMTEIINSINGMIEFYEKGGKFICHVAIPSEDV